MVFMQQLSLGLGIDIRHVWARMGYNLPEVSGQSINNVLKNKVFYPGFSIGN